MTRPRLTVLEGGDPRPALEVERERLEATLGFAEEAVRAVERAIAEMDTCVAAAEETRRNGIDPQAAPMLRGRREEMYEELARRRRAELVARRDLERLLEEGVG